MPVADKRPLYHLYDALVDFINGAVAVDCDHTQRLAGGNLLVFVEDAAVERGALLLKAVFVASCGRDRTLIALPGARQRAIKIRQQQQGQVGLEAAAQAGVQVAHDLAAQLPAPALVGFAGVGEPVTKHDVPRLQRRLDDFGDRLRAIGEHQPQLREGGKAFGTRVKQQGADAIAYARAPRLTGRRHRQVHCLAATLSGGEAGCSCPTHPGLRR